MRVTFDAENDLAYVCLVDSIGPGEAVRQVTTDDGGAVLDHDSHGRLLGIELFGAHRRLHPDLRRLAERPEGGAR
jgi:uncharacterized protein YuzE